MMRWVKIFGLSVSMAAIAACSSSGTVGGAPGPVTPVSDGNGGTGPASNFIMTDISYGNRSNDDGVSQTFDIATTTMVLQRDGTSGGLVLQESTRGNFESGNTMRYDHDAGTFTFNVDAGNTLFSDVIQNVMITAPNDFGLEFNDEAWVISAVPYFFNLDPADVPNAQAASQFLIGLSESDDEDDQALLEAISDGVADYLDNDFFNFIGANGTRYSQLRLNNNAGTTNYTTLGIWLEQPTANDFTYGVAVWGVRTPDYEVPRTGTATYQATMGGHILQNNNTQFLTGGINFNFDFAMQSMTFTMDADIAETGIDGNTDYFDYDTFTGEGNIYTDTFLGDFVSDTDESITGELEGAFFGADADEVAGTFIFGNDNVQGIGGFVGADPDATSQN